MDKPIFYLKKFRNSNWFYVFLWLSLLALGTIVLYLRYPYAYLHPNFHAEDGTVLLRNYLSEGAIKSSLSLFNGYLILGQYMLFDIAALINYIFGNGLVTFPRAIAVSSYLFFSFVASLPFMLFRKKLGTVLAILCCVCLLLFPLGGYDYAVFGTISNIKFAFLFVATLFILYRNDKKLSDSLTKIVLTDIVLVICVLTNIAVLAILPFGILRYKKELHMLFVKRKNIKITKDIISYALLIVFSLSYVFLVFLKGIPKIPGYLDGPLIPSALVDIFYRSSFYGVIFPISSGMNDIIAYLLFLILFIIVAFKLKEKSFYVVIAGAIVVNVLGFVINRPGVTALYSQYTVDGGPGHFFYAGTLLFVFAVFYAARTWFSKLSVYSKATFVAFVLIYLAVIVPFAGFRQRSYEGIDAKRPTIYSEVDRVCTSSDKTVEIAVYPTAEWTIKIDRAKVCQTQ